MIMISNERSEMRIRLNKQNRIKQLRRRTLFAIISVVTFVLFIFIINDTKSIANDGSVKNLYKYFSNVYVNPGDTLTSIHDDYDLYDKYTVKAFTEEVVFINNLSSADDIKAGTYLVVPYYDMEHCGEFPGL